MTINATTPAEAGAQITMNELRRDAIHPYRHVRIELPNGDEYELSFCAQESESEMLAENLSAWRVI